MKLIKSKKGFTLIELMIVVAIIGILAAIAIPQFANLVSKSQEGATKGNLGTLRSALSIYYGDTEGFYPIDNLGTLTVGQRYLQNIPALNLPKTTSSIGHSIGDIGVDAGVMSLAADKGNWYYDNSGSGDNFWGSVVVGCSHKDIRGSTWTYY